MVYSQCPRAGSRTREAAEQVRTVGPKQERRGALTSVHHLRLQNSRTQLIMQKEDETKTLLATAREDLHWEKQVNSRGLLTG